MQISNHKARPNNRTRRSVHGFDERPYLATKATATTVDIERNVDGSPVVVNSYTPATSPYYTDTDNGNSETAFGAAFKNALH